MKEEKTSVKLYRFLGADSGLKTIEQRRFRIGRLDELNDPFEWRVGLSNIDPKFALDAEAVMDRFVKTMSSNMGILCFSDTGSDPVLWSHYSDSHRGIAFEVDYEDDSAIFPIKYTESRPALNTHRLKDKNKLNSYLESVLEKLLFQKASSWGYERESRVYVDLKGCETSGGHYFTPIPDDFLKRVILGFWCARQSLASLVF